MILENLKQYVFLVVKLEIALLIWTSKMIKYIKEFKTETKPQNNSNINKVKEEVIVSAMALFKGREMVFRAFESGIFSNLK